MENKKNKDTPVYKVPFPFSMVRMAHRQFGQRQFSQFEIQTIQPEIYRQFGQRQFSQFYKTLDSKEKKGIGAISRFKVAGGRATRASPLRGDNRL